eukprot:COSAG03_NODE_7548_length_902_cov_4.108344_1_plen_95_part_00
MRMMMRTWAKRREEMAEGLRRAQEEEGMAEGQRRAQRGGAVLLDKIVAVAGTSAEPYHLYACDSGVAVFVPMTVEPRGETDGTPSPPLSLCMCA